MLREKRKHSAGAPPHTLRTTHPFCTAEIGGITVLPWDSKLRNRLGGSDKGAQREVL